MPLSQSLEEEGLCLSPTYLLHGGVMPEATFAALGSSRGAHPSPGAGAPRRALKILLPTSRPERRLCRRSRRRRRGSARGRGGPS